MRKGRSMRRGVRVRGGVGEGRAGGKGRWRKGIKFGDIVLNTSSGE